MALQAVPTPFVPYPRSGSEPQGTAPLPDPTPLLHNLTQGILEVIAGMRPVEQLARWVSEEAFRTLVIRANLAARTRSARGVPATTSPLVVTTVRCTWPADDAVEATVIVSGKARTRAVAIRLDEFRGRWRASTIAIL